MANMAMFIDGVLRGHNGAPIYQGLALYKLLNEDNKVFLLSTDKTKDERWLKEHKLLNVDELIGSDIPGVTDDLSFRQVEYARSLGGGFQLAITSDPDLCSKLLEVGITTLLFAHPSYLREEFRPDSRQGVKSWSRIVEELEYQQERFKEDPRVQ